MAVLQGASFSGVESNEVRPQSYSSKSAVQTVCEDQANTFESLSGDAIPDAAGISATEQIHDGTNGALIRIPLAQWTVGAILFARDVAFAGTPAWAPFLHAPFFVPAGVSEVTVAMVVTDPDVVNSLRVSTQDSSLADVDSNASGVTVPDDDWAAPNKPGKHTAFFRVAVTAGEFNCLLCEAWDGFEVPDTNEAPAIGNRSVYTVSVLPVDRAPRVPQPAVVPTRTSDDDVAIRTDAGSSEPYISVDASLVADDRPIDAWLLDSWVRNDALNYELLTDRAYANRATQVHRGHNHRGETTLAVGAYLRSGADMDQPLGAWAYGVVRPNEGTASADYGTVDTLGTGDSVWFGQIVAPTVTTAAGTNECKIARHRFRMPDATDANAGITGSAPKLTVALLVWSDTASNCNAYARIGNKAASTWSSQVTDTFVGADTKTLVTISIKAQDVEELQTLETSIGMTVSKQAACAILGAALAYER